MFFHVVKPLHLRVRYLFNHLVDKAVGIETADEDIAAELGVDIEVLRTTQRSLGWAGVWRIVRSLRLTGDDVFVDIGCGAGRVLCGVGRSGARRAIGVELDLRMVELARRNAASLRGRKNEISIELADASVFDIPDDATVVFLYNPFGGDVLRASVLRIVESLDRRTRSLRVVYVNPKEPEAFTDTGRFDPTSSLRLGWRPNRGSWRTSQAVQVYSAE